jgi:phage terminase large subunit-like protein
LPAENAIGVDPVGVGQILDALAALGIDNSDKRRIVGVSQGWQLTRANGILITKAASGTAKIDALMASFSAVDLMAMNPQPRNTPSVYETRGLLVV